MINVNLPTMTMTDDAEFQSTLMNALAEAFRRGIDGTVVPIFIDYTNQRVLIGEIAASAAPAVMELKGGNFKIVSGANGIILPNSGATNYYLLNITEVTNDDGTVSPVLSLTKQ